LLTKLSKRLALFKNNLDREKEISKLFNKTKDLKYQTSEKIDIIEFDENKF